MTPAGWTVLAILALAIIAFASDRLRADGVALTVLLALAVTGLVTPAEAIAGFADSAVLMVGGLFVVGEALVATGIASRFGALLARIGKGSEARLIALLMMAVGSIGAFMSSTGVVAMFIPVVLGIVATTGFSRGRLMMPLSVAALSSGLLTLIATAPNLVVSAALADRGFDPLGFFELTPIGVTLLLIGVVYMLTVGRWLLNRPEPAVARAGVTIDNLIDSYGLTGRFRGFRIGPGSSLTGQSVGEAQVRTRHGVTLVAIIRQQGARVGIQPAVVDTVMREGDVIGVTADPPVVERFAAIEDLAPLDDDQRLRDAAREALGVAEVMLAPDAPLIGKTLRQAAFRQRRGLTVLAIKHKGQVVAGNLIDVPLRFGDLILVAGGWPQIARLAEDPGEFVVLRLPDELRAIPPARPKAPVAIAIVLAMSATMALGLVANVIAVLAAAVAVVASGCVRPGDAYRSIGWSTLMLIAGMLPLATALDKTGVTAAAATGLTGMLAGVGPYGMLAVLFLITAAVGMFVSNTATAVLIAPVAIGAAETLGVSAHAFAVTVAVASSCAFVTPVSSPVNTLVLEPGRYSFGDFVKVGLPLLMLALVVTVALVGLLYPLGSSG